MVELVSREPCGHGKTYGHVVMAPRAGVDGVCDGYVERVLDPEQVLTIPALAHWSIGYETLSLPLRTVIDALTKEDSDE